MKNDGLELQRWNTCGLKIVLAFAVCAEFFLRMQNEELKRSPTQLTIVNERLTTSEWKGCRRSRRSELEEDGKRLIEF